MSDIEKRNGVAGVEREIGEIARGAGVGLGGNVIYYAVSYLFGILVARQIGAEQYGLYTLGVTAVSLISRIAIVGLDRGLMRYAAISRGEGRGAALRQVTRLAILAGAITGLIGGVLVGLYPGVVLSVLRWSDKQALLNLLPWLAITVPAMALTGIAIAGTQAFRTMRYRALVVNVIQPSVKLIAALALIPLLGAGAIAPVLGFVAAQVIGTLLALFFLVRLARTAPGVTESSKGIGRQLARFSAPLLLSNVIEYLNGRTEIFVLGMFLMADMAGIYNAAIRFAGLGLIVLTAFNAIFSPVISDLHNRGQIDRLATLFKLVTRWIVAAAMPIFLVQMLFASQLMSLFGDEFVAGTTALQLLSIGQFINICTGSVGIMLVMSGRSDITFINSILTVALALALDFLLVPNFGLVGAAWAGGAVIAAVNLVRLGEVWLLMQVHPFSRAFIKPFVAGIAGLGTGLIWRLWLPLDHVVYLGLAGFAICAIYLFALLALGLDDGDRMMIQALRMRILRVAVRIQNDEAGGV